MTKGRALMEDWMLERKITHRLRFGVTCDRSAELNVIGADELMAEAADILDAKDARIAALEAELTEAYANGVRAGLKEMNACLTEAHEERAALQSQLSTTAADLDKAVKDEREAISAIVNTKLNEYVEKQRLAFLRGRDTLGNTYHGSSCAAADILQVLRARALHAELKGEGKPKPHYQPKIRTCSKCGAKAIAFVCSKRGCPVNGGAAHD